MPSTPRRRTKRSNKSNKGNKIVEDDFSPRSCRLAVKAKTFLRKSIAINPFPKTVPVEAKDQFLWKILQEAADGNETLEQVLQEANEFKRLRLTTFVSIIMIWKPILMPIFQVWYGRSGLLSSLITKARAQVPILYGLVAQELTQDDIKDKVSWLLDDGNFKFGGIKWTGDADVCCI